MKVNALPQPAPRAMYDEAIAAFPRYVRSRALAVYQVGNVRFPGLSDIDFLVVPKRPARDNQYFFSVFHRLPRPQLRLFLHEPFIVPPTSTDVVRFTTHAKATLLYGEDVLAGTVPANGNAERVCRMLESYCSYERFVERARATGELNGRWSIAVFSACRFLLDDFDAVFGRQTSEAYKNAIDAIRANAFDEGVSRAILRGWEIFERHMTTVADVLARQIGSREGLVAPLAREVLRGERTFDGVPRDYARERYDAIANYHDELERFGFPFGHMFFSAAYEGSLRAVPPPPDVRYVTRNFYRLQRRIREHVHV